MYESADGKQVFQVRTDGFTLTDGAIPKLGPVRWRGAEALEEIQGTHPSRIYRTFRLNYIIRFLYPMGRTFPRISEHTWKFHLIYRRG